MQPHQYALAAGIGWMVTLIILPFLIAKARQSAYSLGFEAGKACNDQTLKLQLMDAQKAQEELRTELQRTRQDCSQQLEARQNSITALRVMIADLNDQILAHVGLAVTKSDYTQLVTAAATMRLAQRTFIALRSQPEADRAAAQADSIDELAKRIHAQLRSTPDSTVNGEAAA